MRTPVGRALFAGALALAACALAIPAAAQEPAATPAIPAATSATPAAAPFRWTDPDGKPLPFTTEDELLVFLRTADVKKEKGLSGGITFPTKLLLEKDGVRADAVFKDVHEEKMQATFASGRAELFFRDDYIFEPAAYEMSRLLGLDTVPPTTLRKLHGRPGSVQIWVENSMTERKRVADKIEPPDEVYFHKQLQMMNVFDALIYNTDRSRGNMLITPDWKVWWIDHTRAFRRIPSLQEPKAVHQCERGLYERLKSLDEAAVKQRLKDYLNTYEIDALLKRRLLILEILDKAIAEHGEAQVLWTFSPEHPAPRPAAIPD